MEDSSPFFFDFFPLLHMWASLGNPNHDEVMFPGLEEPLSSEPSPLESDSLFSPESPHPFLSLDAFPSVEDPFSSSPSEASPPQDDFSPNHFPNNDLHSPQSQSSTPSPTDFVSSPPQGGGYLYHNQDVTSPQSLHYHPNPFSPSPTSPLSPQQKNLPHTQNPQMASPQSPSIGLFPQNHTHPTQQQQSNRNFPLSVSGLTTHLNSDSFVKQECQPETLLPPPSPSSSSSSPILPPSPSTLPPSPLNPHYYNIGTPTPNFHVKQEPFGSPTPLSSPSLFGTGETPKEKRASRKTKRSQRVAAVRASRVEVEQVQGEESPEEAARKKKERRMIRNRESALQSRLRKKQELESANERAKELEGKNQELMTQNQQLLRENEQLKATVRRLQQQAAQSTGGGGVVRGGIVAFVFLFAIGFSFGFFPTSSFPLVSQQTPLRTGRTLKEIGSLGPVPSPSSSEMVLLSPFPSSPSTLPEVNKKEEGDSASSSSSSLSSSLPLLSYLPTKKSQAKQSPPPPSPPSKQVRGVAGETESRPVNSHYRLSARNKLLHNTTKLSGEVREGTARGEDEGGEGRAPVVMGGEAIDFEEDTAYFFCSEGERILPSSSSSLKKKVSVFVPSHYFNFTEVIEEWMEGEEGGDDWVVGFERGEFLVEVSCQVSNVNFYPLPETPSSALTF